MKEWTEFLISADVNNEFKIIINRFIIPNKILFKQFFINLEVVIKGDGRFTAETYVSKSLRLERVFPQFYPVWFVAGFPDVVIWVLDYSEKSKVFNSLTDDFIIKLQEDVIKKNDFIEKLIFEYLIVEKETLECTDKYNIEYENRMKEYPKKEFDEYGRLKKKIILQNGYIINSKYFYNKNNQIIRIDKWGDDSYGKWELIPFMLFEFEEDGLLRLGIEYLHGGKQVKLKYINEYNDNGQLINRTGLYRLNYKNIEYELHLVYNGEYVDILIFNKYYKESLLEKYTLLQQVKADELITILNTYTGYDQFS